MLGNVRIKNVCKLSVYFIGFTDGRYLEWNVNCSMRRRIYVPVICVAILEDTTSAAVVI
jgi:hypothetical protein